MVEPSGYPLAFIAARLRENMEDTPIPFALVAHDGEAVSALVQSSNLISGSGRN